MNPLQQTLSCLPSRFQSVAHSSPQQACLEIGRGKFTYEQVALWSNRLAQILSERGIADRPVAICMPKCLEFYLSQLAVMQAGGFFIPIDPNNPADRISYLLEDSQAEVLLTCIEHPLSTHLELSATSIETTLEVESQSLINSATPSRPFPTHSGEKTAYMIYTSGSTGQPKGVPIHNDAIFNHNDWCLSAYKLTNTDRVLQFASISFDISIEEIFPTYLAGASLIIAPETPLQSLSDFITWITEEQITVLNLPTAFWHEFVQAIEHNPLPPSVRLVIIGGERVSPNLVDKWFELAPAHVPLLNAYGPTETTITSSFTILRPGAPVTIGKAITGLRYHILDEDFRPQSAGQEGELAISGSGLSKGYWNRPDLTERAFINSNEGRLYRTGDKVRKLPSGDYEYLGRIDEQIKIRGYRIEPGEIEATIVKHPAIAKAIVRPHQQAGQTTLVGYYLCGQDHLANPEDLRLFLNERLPSFMVPLYLIALDRIPVTTVRKVDFNSLPKPSSLSSQQDYKKAVTDTEKVVSNFWEMALGIKEASVTSDFFELGGTSLIALRLVFHLEKKFPHLTLPVSLLAKHPSIESLSQYIDNAAGNNAAPFEGKPLVTVLNKDTSTTPIIAIHGSGGAGLIFREFESTLPNRHPFYLFESGLLSAQPSTPLPQTSIEEIASLYLNTLQRLIGTQKPILMGYSTGGLIAYEMARQAKAKGLEIQAIINLDAPDPQCISPAPKSLYFSRVALTALVRPHEFCERIIRNWKSSQKKGHKKTDALSPDQQSNLNRIQTVYEKIESSYQPGTYPGDLHLVAATGGELCSITPKDLGWNPHIKGKLHLSIVPGTHLTMLSPRNLPTLLETFAHVVATTDPIKRITPIQPKAPVPRKSKQIKRTGPALQ